MDIFSSDSELCFADFINYPEIKIPADSFTFITGKSGCGKSSYLKMLNATVIPSRGIIKYRGTPISEFSILDYRRKVTLVPQKVFLFDGTIRENFDKYYEMRETPAPSDEQIKEFLTICCADFPIDANCTSLSGGEQQRVFLSIFLSCKPDALLLDEPTAALDEKNAHSLFSSLKEFCSQNKITLVCVCHSRELADEFAEYEIRLGENS